MDDLTAEFVAEATESLGELDTELVKLEKDAGDQAMVAGILRIVHTIKGTCGFLDLPRLEALAHVSEGVLEQVREGVLAADETTITPVLEAIDRIKAVLAGLEADGVEPAGDDGDLLAAMRVLSGEDAEEEFVDLGPPLAECADLPPDTAVAPTKAAPPPSPQEMAQASAAARSIRVAVTLLEDLIVVVSELVLTRNQLLQIQRREDVPAFAVPLQRLNHITTELQEGVMRTRMQPISAAWSKLPRIVRDLEQELGKRIDLDMIGGGTDLDRQVLEMIRDPLVHMVRNSCDHGLEPPEDRRAAGKNETGRITLHAYHEGGFVVIRIADDGRGLAVDRIREKALAVGLATPADLKMRTANEICQFIFAPGFSTAAEISSVSGRGVGMDVVRESIEAFGGVIDVDSIEGVGSTFTIRIPLTLAIVSALIVECAGERFAVPQGAVRELVRAGGSSSNRIEDIGGAPVLRLRGRLLPLAPLAQMLDLGAPELTAELAEGVAPAERHIVVCETDFDRFGIVVDKVHDTEEVVVKPLAPLLRDNPIFSGNTVLGDGDVVMILDPPGVAADVNAEGLNGLDAAEFDRAGADDAQDRTPVLLFRAGPGALKLAPLSTVARLEDVPASAIQQADGRDVVAFRGAMMPLLDLAPRDPTETAYPVIVFSDGRRWAGLLVEEIVDIVDVEFKLLLDAREPGSLGGMLVDGASVDAVDVDFHLRRIYPDWRPEEAAIQRRNEILVVDDSPFFRHLLNPLLRQAGYDVTAVDSAATALALKDAGRRFDLIVSDLDMPEMDGFAFAEAVRSSREWRDTPLVAMCEVGETGADRPEAAFVNFVGKNDRDALLDSLTDALSVEGGRS